MQKKVCYVPSKEESWLSMKKRTRQSGTYQHRGDLPGNNRRGRGFLIFARVKLGGFGGI